MVRVYGSWPADRSNTWGRFALLDINSAGLGGVGNVHFPVNATSDYDYANPRFVQGNADAWLTYPNLNNTTRAMNFHEWTPLGLDPQREYLNWWYAHMPHAPSRAPDFYLANWWRYLLDTDQFKAGLPTLRLTLGLPSVRVTHPSANSSVGGVVHVVASAEVDGALGRVDFYVDGAYRATDYLASYTLEWPTLGLVGTHTLVAKAYELQNGTEGISPPISVLTPCPPDFDGDGFATGDDFDGYVLAFVAGANTADYNGDGFVTGDDFDGYVAAFEAGC